jgi:hypothetical protein
MIKLIRLVYNVWITVNRARTLLHARPVALQIIGRYKLIPIINKVVFV